MVTVYVMISPAENVDLFAVLVIIKPSAFCRLIGKLFEVADEIFSEPASI